MNNIYMETQLVYQLCKLCNAPLKIHMNHENTPYEPWTDSTRNSHDTERSLQWRHNGRHGVSNHQPHDCLLNRLFRRRSKKTWKFRVTGLCEGNSPVTGEFPAQMASNAENVSVWWRHHVQGCILAKNMDLMDEIRVV